MARTAKTQIKGLLPLIDRKRVPEPFVVDGRNFAVTADGPVSAFARTTFLYRGFRLPKGIQSFRIDRQETSFIFTRSALFKYDAEQRQVYPLLTVPLQQDLFPWSHATVGGNFYFARKGVGAIEFNTLTGVWRVMSGVDVPANIVACAASGGRLALLAEGILAWSAIDDGNDLVPSTTTGAGFQSLAMVNATGPGEALMVLPYANGLLTYTKNGIMKSELVLAVNPFRHRPLSTKHVPINAWSVIAISDNEHVLLTRNAFYKTDGNVPEIWQPFMSEFFHLSVLPTLNLDLDMPVRLTFDFDRQWFFVSLALSVEEGIFNKAYMLYLPSNEWGSFDRIHTSFLDFRVDEGTDIGFHLSYIDHQGSANNFTDGTVDDIFPTGKLSYYDLKGFVEWPARREDGVNRMPTVMQLRTQNEGVYTLGPGVYDRDFEIVHKFSPVPFSIEPHGIPTLQTPADWDGGTSIWDNGDSIWDVGSVRLMSTRITMHTGLRHTRIVFAEKNLVPLDSFIDIGVFRFVTEEAVDIDELTTVLGLSISALEAAGDKDVFEDYIGDFLGPVDVLDDWQLPEAGPNEDWGFGQAATSEYTVQLTGTIDGVTPWQEQQVEPEIIGNENRTRFYASNITGIYHIVQISAFKLNESYHVKTLEIDSIPAGRLM